MCSQYLYEVNSCYSTTGLCYCNIGSVSSTGDAGTGSQLWKFLSGLVLQEHSRKNLFMSYLVSIPGFFPFHFQRHILNFWRKTVISLRKHQIIQRVQFQHSKVSVDFYLLCSHHHQPWVFPHKVHKLSRYITNFILAIVSYKWVQLYVRKSEYCSTSRSNTDYSALKTQAVTVKERWGDRRQRTAMRTSCTNPSVVNLFS